MAVGSVLQKTRSFAQGPPVAARRRHFAGGTLNHMDEPTLPLSDENGRFLPGINALPAKRIAGRIWHFASLPTRTAADAAALANLLDGTNVPWTHPAATNGSGCTPLHIACIVGHRAAAQLLVDYRTSNDDLNLRDSFGNTALMAAAARGRSACAAVLLRAGADPNIKNKRGYMALNAAVDAGHADCVGLISAHGGRQMETARPATARRECERTGAAFHWDRGLASQAWWTEQNMPMATRRSRELDAQLTKHVLSSVPDAQLLETPLDRFSKAERSYQKQFQKVAQRQASVRERDAIRQAKLHAWHQRVGRGSSPSPPFL